jgi:hypothetical protein
LHVPIIRSHADSAADFRRFVESDQPQISQNRKFAIAADAQVRSAQPSIVFFVSLRGFVARMREGGTIFFFIFSRLRGKNLSGEEVQGSE